MNKISQIFENNKAFIAFLTAGDPDAESTISYIKEIANAGADLIEIGIPFSDPTAEGIVIQEANIRALRNGMNTEKVFEIVKEVRKEIKIPLVFMTYLNPVFHYGYDNFFKKCEELEVDGIIIPDLPFEEKAEVEIYANKHKVTVISMIAPTSKQRIKKIAKEAKGFIYIVSSMGVTGVRNEIQTDLDSIIKSIREVTETPCAIGFGINTEKQAAEMAKIADGVIVGSAIIKIIEKNKNQVNQELNTYVKKMKKATEVVDKI